MDKKAKFQISGHIVSIGDTVVFQSGFAKRDVIIDTGSGNYLNPIKVTLKKDDCSMADSLGVGDGVNVEGFVDGREWNGPMGTQHFINLTAKSIMVAEKSHTSAGAAEDKGGAVASWKELLGLGTVFGEDEAAVTKRCQDYKARNNISGKFTERDWQALADEMSAAHGGGGVSAHDDDEDMPF